MGHSHGGKNGTGFQSGEQLLAQKNNIEVLIEFLYVKDAKVPLRRTIDNANTFSHIGLIVPDILAAQATFEAFGATILKRVGMNPVEGDPAGDDVAVAFGLSEVRASSNETAAAPTGIAGFGFTQFIIVADPDGNLIEVQQQY
ncbi:hypothetical protein DL98DRAFT_662097 [Cadophora sp. DSE1049]|nr:hypothetical protein DL98DRAFT_662097 [Cadophora sp. DSE1049]